jgi:hypothetical protein
MAAIVIRSLGATAPALPSTEDGAISGAANAVPTALTPPFTNCRRETFLMANTSSQLFLQPTRRRTSIVRLQKIWRTCLLELVETFGFFARLAAFLLANF